MPADSIMPRKTPGGLRFGLAAALMLLAAVGLIAWKLSRDREQPAQVVEIARPTAQPPAPALAEPPPPPPPVETAHEAPSATAQPRGRSRGAGGFCGDCAGTVTGALQGALQGQARRATGCYERALRMNPGLEGRMVLGVKVGPDGHVCSAGVSSSTLGDASVTTCVLQMFRSGVFPPPKGGCVEVEVPINFVPRT